MNLVRLIREAKKMQKKEVLDQSAGLLSAHRLNQIEAEKGWRPRDFEKAALANILAVPVETLFREE